MKVTVNFTFVFIIAILCAKSRGTNRAGEVFDVILVVEGSNI